MIRLLAQPLPPLSRDKVVSLSQSSCMSPVELTDGSGEERVGEELNHTTHKKAWPSTNHSTLSALL